MGDPAVFYFSICKAFGFGISVAWGFMNTVVSINVFCFFLEINIGPRTHGWLSFYNEFKSFEENS